MNRSTTSVILLAAGASKRMGNSIKQLLPWGDTTLLGHAINQLKPLKADIYVVLGAFADEIKTHVPKEATLLVNTEWQNGMGSSIAYGVNEVLKNAPQTKSILIALADQPLVNSAYLKKLLGQHIESQEGITATAYPNQRVGVPAIFDEKYFSVLQKLKGDKGARELLNSKNQRLTTLPIVENGFDVDTEDDYRKILIYKGYIKSN